MTLVPELVEAFLEATRGFAVPAASVIPSCQQAGRVGYSKIH
jgi:hypothetical protein